MKFSWRLALSLAIVVMVGCGGDDESKLIAPTDALANGGQDAATTDAPASVDTAPKDTFTISDTSLNGTLDAGGDASPARLNVLYATFGTTLVRIDPETGASTQVGVLKNAAAPSQLFTDVSMTWDQGDQARATIGFMSPKLATVNLCNAQVTVGPTLTRAASPNLVVEGLARHPNGTWYVSSGNSTSTLSPNLSTIDITTGIITSLGGAAATLQNDIDQMIFVGAKLYAIDVSTDVNKVELFTLNVGSGVVVNSVVATQTDEALRIAYDESRGQSFAWRVGDRKLLSIDLNTAAVTPIGETHPATAYGNATIRGFFSAPYPRCSE